MFGLFLSQEPGESDDIGLDALGGSWRIRAAVGAIGRHECNFGRVSSFSREVEEERGALESRIDQATEQSLGRMEDWGSRERTEGDAVS
jgi:hypothetical protein